MPAPAPPAPPEPSAPLVPNRSALVQAPSASPATRRRMRVGEIMSGTSFVAVSCLSQALALENAPRAPRGSLLQRPPGGVARAARGFHPPQVAPCYVHRVEPRLAGCALCLAGEHDDPAIGCPGRPLVEEGRGEQPLLAAIGAHHADMEAPLGLLGKGDEIAARGPDRCAVAPLSEADAARLAAARVHYVELRAPG